MLCIMRDARHATDSTNSKLLLKDPAERHDCACVNRWYRRHKDGFSFQDYSVQVKTDSAVIIRLDRKKHFYD